ncbi:MAG: glucose-1-phosphate thymidylyltransferase RfbA [Maricaulaceae bacterium]|nr:glucose-1-phosphate thymidylyltransferase RfbA [Maricaulaceae bacterium]
MKPRKGIILAGGSGTRLRPLTLAVSKQLLPVYDKPMIYYPLTTLMLAGIRDILIITTAEDQAAFQRLLGDGSQWGLNLSYAVQDQPDGVARAFVIGADFLRGHPACLILGDNILYGHGIQQAVQDLDGKKGATVFGYHVDEPEQYGVVQFDKGGKVVSIEEKPRKPKSSWAVIGLYFYDDTVLDRVGEVKPSKRGEYEITDLNNLYLRDGQLRVERLGRGFAWFDTGSCHSLLEASSFVRALQARQGQLVASPEEIAYHNRWITIDDLEKAGRRLAKTEYGKALLERARLNGSA